MHSTTQVEDWQLALFGGLKYKASAACPAPFALDGLSLSLYIYMYLFVCDLFIYLSIYIYTYIFISI